MPKTRKKKIPVVSSRAANTPASSKSQVSRAIIREFHVLLKERAKLHKLKSLKESDKETLNAIDHRIHDLGGLENYQRMSAIGQGEDRGGGSEKVLIQWLKDLQLSNRPAGTLKLLEVGALKPDNYKSCSSWIECTPIDLHSRHPLIVEQDFLLMNKTENSSKWDIISLSLVLNFVSDPRDRGLMLRCAYDMLDGDGYLFLALPLPCVSNSRYLTFEQMQSMMHSVGFLELRNKWRDGGKMVYWLYQKHSDPPQQELITAFHRKTTLRQGPRNNFSILL